MKSLKLNNASLSSTLYQRKTGEQTMEHTAYKREETSARVTIQGWTKRPATQNTSSRRNLVTKNVKNKV